MLENIQAEGLLLRFKEEMVKWETRLKAVESEKWEVYKIKNLAQEVCTHPKTREEGTPDYHNNTEWTRVICTICDKQVRKY